MSQPRMIPFYEPPNWATTIHWCTRCGRWWAVPRQRVSCAVVHLPETCCHMGEVEVSIIKESEGT